MAKNINQQDSFKFPTLHQKEDDGKVIVFDYQSNDYRLSELTIKQYTDQINKILEGASESGDTLKELHDLILELKEKASLQDLKDGTDEEKRIVPKVLKEFIDYVIGELKGSVPTAGDTLNKLYNLIQDTYTKSETDTKLGDKADKNYTDTELGKKVDKEANKGLISNTDKTQIGTNKTDIQNLQSAITSGVKLEDEYNASTNTPNLDGRGSSTIKSGIKKGHLYIITADGNFFTDKVEEGDSLIAKKDNPTKLSDWIVKQGNVVDATTTQKGVVELATQTEIENGTGKGVVTAEDAKVEFDKKYDKTAAATEKTRVNKELGNKQNNLDKATGLDITAGTDDDKYVTPKAIEDSDLLDQTDVINNLTSDYDSKPVAAKQAKILDEKKANKTDVYTKTEIDNKDFAKRSEIPAGSVVDENFNKNSDNALKNKTITKWKEGVDDLQKDTLARVNDEDYYQVGEHLYFTPDNVPNEVIRTATRTTHSVKYDELFERYGYRNSFDVSNSDSLSVGSMQNASQDLIDLSKTKIGTEFDVLSFPHVHIGSLSTDEFCAFSVIWNNNDTTNFGNVSKVAFLVWNGSKWVYTRQTHYGLDETAGKTYNYALKHKGTKLAIVPMKLQDGETTPKLVIKGNVKAYKFAAPDGYFYINPPKQLPNLVSGIYIDQHGSNLNSTPIKFTSDLAEYLAHKHQDGEITHDEHGIEFNAVGGLISTNKTLELKEVTLKTNNALDYKNKWVFGNPDYANGKYYDKSNNAINFNSLPSSYKTAELKFIQPDGRKVKITTPPANLPYPSNTHPNLSKSVESVFHKVGNLSSWFKKHDHRLIYDGQAGLKIGKVSFGNGGTIHSAAYFDTVDVWIEHADGSETRPNPLKNIPYESSLRTKGLVKTLVLTRIEIQGLTALKADDTIRVQAKRNGVVSGVYFGDLNIELVDDSSATQKFYEIPTERTDAKRSLYGVEDSDINGKVDGMSILPEDTQGHKLKNYEIGKITNLTGITKNGSPVKMPSKMGDDYETYTTTSDNNSFYVNTIGKTSGYAVFALSVVFEDGKEPTLTKILDFDDPKNPFYYAYKVEGTNEYRFVLRADANENHRNSSLNRIDLDLPNGTEFNISSIKFNQHEDSLTNVDWKNLPILNREEKLDSKIEEVEHGLATKLDINNTSLIRIVDASKKGKRHFDGKYTEELAANINTKGSGDLHVGGFTTSGNDKEDGTQYVGDGNISIDDSQTVSIVDLGDFKVRKINVTNTDTNNGFVEVRTPLNITTKNSGAFGIMFLVKQGTYDSLRNIQGFDGNSSLGNSDYDGFGLFHNRTKIIKGFAESDGTKWDLILASRDPNESDFVDKITVRLRKDSGDGAFEIAYGEIFGEFKPSNLKTISYSDKSTWHFPHTSFQMLTQSEWEGIIAGDAKKNLSNVNNSDFKTKGRAAGLAGKFVRETIMGTTKSANGTYTLDSGKRFSDYDLITVVWIYHNNEIATMTFPTATASSGRYMTPWVKSQKSFWRKITDTTWNLSYYGSGFAIREIQGIKFR